MTLNGSNTKVLKNGDPEPSPPTPGVFRIYSMRFCPFAQRVLIYAAKKQIPTNLIGTKKHPNGQVPTLEHDGKIVIESSIIPEYLDDILPETRVLPTDPYEKAQVKILLGKVDAINSTIYGVVMTKPEDSARALKLDALKKAFDKAETLLENDFYSGTSPGFVDYMIYPNFQRAFWISNIQSDIPFNSVYFPGTEKYPKLTEWYSKMEKLPEVIEGSQPPEKGIEFFKGYTVGQADFDHGL